MDPAPIRRQLFPISKQFLIHLPDSRHRPCSAFPASHVRCCRQKERKRKHSPRAACQRTTPFHSPIVPGFYPAANTRQIAILSAKSGGLIYLACSSKLAALIVAARYRMANESSTAKFNRNTPVPNVKRRNRGHCLERHSSKPSASTRPAASSRK